MRVEYDNRLGAVKEFFSKKVSQFGPVPQGADFNSLRAQEIRFDQILKLFHHDNHFSINDYGCGYGALAHYMKKQSYYFTYHGFDISEEMIYHANELKDKEDGWYFTYDIPNIPVSDYTVASGVFNVKLNADMKLWTEYILHTLNDIAKLSRKGFGFNMLTKYSDKDRMRPDLYYGDPLFFFDYCKTHFSKNVALLHDYELYDFTILVRIV